MKNSVSHPANGTPRATVPTLSDIEWSHHFADYLVPSRKKFHEIEIERYPSGAAPFGRRHSGIRDLDSDEWKSLLYVARREDRLASRMLSGDLWMIRTGLLVRLVSPLNGLRRTRESVSLVLSRREPIVPSR